MGSRALYTPMRCELAPEGVNDSTSLKQSLIKVWQYEQ